MMLLICSSTACGLVIRVVGDQQQVSAMLGPSSDFYPDRYKCACGAPAGLAFEEDINPQSIAGHPLRTLEAEEAFRVQYGLGLPEEQNCSRRNVEEALRRSPIKRVGGHEVAGSSSFILEFFELQDCTRLYFSASTHGAAVYRIVPPGGYAKKILEELDG